MDCYIPYLVHAAQIKNPQEFKLRTKTHRNFHQLADKYCPRR